MNASPLRLNDYYVTEINFSVNKAFDVSKPVNLQFEDLVVRPTVIEPSAEGKPWQVSLRIQQQTAPDKNAPYAFSLEIVGLFDIHPGYAVEKRRRLVEVNGSSMLYGAVREMIRSITSHGPFMQGFLPSVSFYPQKEAAQPRKPESTV